MYRAVGDQRGVTGTPSVRSSTDSATSTPNWWTSTLIVVSAGEASRHRVESSHATRLSRSGTATPSSTAAARPATAITSLSYMIAVGGSRSEEHTSELQSQSNLVC